jgi:hypothetical protein
MLRSGELVRRCGSRVASSEAEIRLRGRQALERGRDPPKGVSSPRVRRRLGGMTPGPRARWRFGGAAPGPRARQRFAQGVLRPAVWWAATAFWAVGPSPLRAATTRSALRGLWGVCLFSLFLERGVSPIIRGPVWLSPTVFQSKEARRGGVDGDSILEVLGPGERKGGGQLWGRPWM